MFPFDAKSNWSYIFIFVSGQSFIVAIRVQKKIKKKPFLDKTRLAVPPVKVGGGTPAPTVTTPGSPTKPSTGSAKLEIENKARE